MASGIWRLRPYLRGPGRSTTRRLLISLLAGLLTLSLLVFVACLLVFTRVHDTAAEVRDRTVPAIGEIVAAKSALLRADRAAIANFTSGGVQLAGPGDEFRNQIAIASQSLTRVAEHNMAGDVGSGALQLVQGLVVSYVGMIGQADAHFRQADGETLGAVDLWNASRLLHRPGGVLVDQLDALLVAHQGVLDRQLADTATTPGTAVVVLLPAFALMTLLGFTSWLFFRRFRRRVNPWLVSAAVVLVSLVMITVRVAGANERLENTRHLLYGLVAEQRAVDGTTVTSGQRELRELVGRTCDDPAGCGYTLAEFDRAVEALRDSTSATTEGVLAAETREVTEQAAAATVDTGLRVWLSVLAVLLAGTMLLGFRPRLNEYRFRSR
ncbi:hypothetical protein [Actinophytocola sediminis]